MMFGCDMAFRFRSFVPELWKLLRIGLVAWRFPQFADQETAEPAAQSGE